MTPRFILDTDTLQLYQEGNPTVITNLSANTGHGIATTIITAEEQLRGRFDQVRKAEDGKGNLPEAYLRLRGTIVFYTKIPILDYTPKAHDIYNTLRKDGLTNQKVKPRDLRIACIALDLQATVVTRNQRDFAHVPNLGTVDWSK